ncbi:MAG: hypothetical protein ACF8QF_00935 [Phycisphaerales bacterium]
MRFPVDDWQFWVATAIFLACAVWILRSLPIPIIGKKRKRTRQKATLTVGGKPVE